MKPAPCKFLIWRRQGYAVLAALRWARYLGDPGDRAGIDFQMSRLSLVRKLVSQVTVVTDRMATLMAIAKQKCA